MAPAPPSPSASPELRLRVGEMDCSSCVTKIQHHLRTIHGVYEVEGLVLSRTLTVRVDPALVSPDRIRHEVGRLGYSSEPIADGSSEVPERPSPWTTRSAVRAYVAAGLIALGSVTMLTADPAIVTVLGRPLPLSGLCLLLAAGVGGWNFFPKGLAAARRLALDMNFLMTVAIVGAVLLGELFEAASIAVLFSLAELLESYSVDRARRSIESLMEMAPDFARVVRDGVERTVPLASVVVGDVVAVRPGDRIPTDGSIVDGRSAIDQSPITGESMPVDKGPGDPVFSGTINREGRVLVRVEKVAGESALAKIVRLVEEAETSKSRAERFVERFARYYTPSVTVAAVAIATAPPLLTEASWSMWITRGLTLLVIACPCALVISTPVAVVSGLTAAARRGVLIKGGVYLEALASVRAFALDKTGTLTLGHPVVRAVIGVDGEPDDALSRAAALESRSEHPLARAIVEEARRRGLDPGRHEVSDFRAIPGEGVVGTIAGVEHRVGRPSALDGASPPEDLEGAGCTVVGVVAGGRLLAWVSLADRKRDEARSAVAELRARGVERVVMLTGDARKTAEAIGAGAGIDEVRAELLPEDKLRVIRELSAGGRTVAMVGDGVNDAPALAAATVGIAMGAAGSDAALEAADVALMGDDLRGLPYLVGLSQRARRVIRQNIAAAIGIKLVLAIGVPMGFVSLIAAVLVGDLGVSLAVTLNALRLVGPVDPVVGEPGR